jgi:hypothetical protein
MNWVAIIEDADSVSGTIGACVEALDSDGAQLAAGSGDPAICHLVSADGDAATAVMLRSWGAELWNSGEVTATPDNVGTEVPAELDATAMGLKVTPAVSVEEIEESEEEESE